jgi:hypothetical protein
VGTLGRGEGTLLTLESFGGVQMPVLNSTEAGCPVLDIITWVAPRIFELVVSASNNYCEGDRLYILVYNNLIYQ